MTNDRTLLYRGVKGVLRCDEAEVVLGIVGFVTSQYRSLQLAAALIARTTHTAIPAVMALARGIWCFSRVRVDGGRGVAWVGRFANERHAIGWLRRLTPELEWREFAFSRPRVSLVLPRRGGLRTLRQILRLARRLHRRHEYFKVLRVVELLLYYSRYVQLFESANFSMAVTSNHSNPHGIAFNLAARRRGVPVVLVAHGMPVWPVAPLSYDLGVVHCRAAMDIYQRAGCRMHRTIIHGRGQHHVPISVSTDASIVVGVFLSKDTREQRLRLLLQSLLDSGSVKRILVRPHPLNLWDGLDAFIEGWHSPKIGLSRERSVFEDVHECDVVFAGNSSIHVEAVTAGRPSCYVHGLDFGPYDLHSFVARGLIWEPPADRPFDPQEAFRFYQRSGWVDRLREFANIDEDVETVGRHVRAAILDLNTSRHPGCDTQAETEHALPLQSS